MNINYFIDTKRYSPQSHSTVHAGFMVLILNKEDQSDVKTMNNN